MEVTMKVARIPVIVAVLSALLLALSGLGVHAGLWPYPTGFGMLGWSAYGGLAAAAGALLAMAIPKVRAGAVGGLVFSLCLGLGVAYLPWSFMQAARALPPIHDITTDMAEPPQFRAILPLRAGAPNPSGYGGAEVAAAQKKGYPDLAPLELAASPGAAFESALKAATAMGWQVVAAVPGEGRIEATATTLWFGFKDDVVVRVTPNAAGSRIDVRSVSRVGKSDIGTNAKRIREYLAKVKASEAKP
jgi:uncharacterized protein (DUF1499 family)